MIYRSFPLAVYFTLVYYGSEYTSIPISQFIPHSALPPTVSTRPFSMSVSLFLPCKYYSAIKRNEIGSFEVMWMNNLESVTRSEVSQKERNKYCISSVQSLSRVRLFGTPWTVACQASLSITNSWSLPKLMSIE